MTEPNRALLEGYEDQGDLGDLDDATVVVDRDDDATIVVARSRPRGDGAAEHADAPGVGGDDDHDVDATVVVARARPVDDDHDDDATIVVSRGGGSGEADDATVVVARSGATDDGATDDGATDDDATVVVRDASARAAEPMLHPAGEIMKAPTRRDRRRPAPAPVSDEVLRTAEPGVGPGLADHYSAREVAVAAPAPRPVRPAGPAPTRDPAAVLPSVARRSRRSSVVVITAFATACLVAFGGLVAIIVTAVAAPLG